MGKSSTNWWRAFYCPVWLPENTSRYFSASVADSILSLPCVSHWRITYILDAFGCRASPSNPKISMTRDSKSSNCGSTRQKMIFQACFSEFFYLALTIGFLPMEWFFASPISMFLSPLSALKHPLSVPLLSVQKFSAPRNRHMSWIEWKPWDLGASYMMLPSGKHTKNDGKSPFLVGKSTINGKFQ